MITAILNKRNVTQRLRVPAVQPAEISNLNQEKIFLYIGYHGECMKKCMGVFDQGYSASSIEDGKSILKKLYGENVTPDFIVIDLPLDEVAFPQFILWLHADKWSYMIPVIYNLSALSLSQFEKLKEMNITDDIVDLKEYCNQLRPKVSILKNSKLINHYRESTATEAEFSSMIRTTFGKRLFDIILSSFLLLILSPIMLVIALLIRFDSKGPIIYKSQRAGRGFKIFDFYKFRTMFVHADKKVAAMQKMNQYGSCDGSPMFFKLKDDPRITRIGKFLRSTSLDELPQLINVLKGDMSIVGNRPLPLYEATTLTTNQASERFIAPAGITGLWQVTKRGREEMDAAERVELDIDYARNQSLLLDFQILLLTPFSVIQKSSV